MAPPPHPTTPPRTTGTASTLRRSSPTSRSTPIGFSLGARTLLATAQEQPGRFRRIVVRQASARTSSGATIYPPEPSRTRSPARAYPSDKDADYFGQLARDPDVDAEALLACLKRLDPPKLTDEGLGRITQPVLVVLGDR